ncbi:MAG TPA: SIS domain-containing protein [Acidimicrobiales bacterium]|nr:SIS domain-containing protein [Acidimicrobiales bacterium]
MTGRAAPPFAAPPGTLDTLGMWPAAAALPEQMALARRAGRGLGRPVDPSTVTGVVVVGTGTAATAGELVAAVCELRLPLPVQSVSSGELPAHVGPGTLVFAISPTGDTDEVVSAAEQATVAGAPVVALTGGGALGAMADAEGWPRTGIAGGLPMDRAALVAMAVPPLVVLEAIGLLPGVDEQLAAAEEQLAARRRQVFGPDSPAAEIARRLGRTIPVVHGAHPLGAVAARHWKRQVNLNAKGPAFSASMPELCHDEVAGWGQSGDVTRQIMTLVTLRTGHELPGIARRFALVAELLDEVVADVVEVVAAGHGGLARLFDLVLVGDAVSLHLAAHDGIDPGPAPAVTDIESALAGG